MTEKRTNKRINHMCDGTDKSRCVCALARKNELLRKRREEQGRSYDSMRKENLARYGLTVGQYDDLRVKQDYCCAICGRHEDELPKNAGGRPRKDGSPPAPGMVLSVDHCHISGAIRGLLCRGCNSVVGMAEGNHPVNSGRTYAYIDAIQEYLSREGTVQELI